VNGFVSVSTGAARLQDISLNPQKLAGQCAKLKCCLNYEVDAYMEAQRNFPSREIPLETKDGVYYHFKTDVFKNQMTYSTDKNYAVNTVTLTAEKVFEVIRMNKKGHKPKSLLPAENEQAQQPKDYQDVLEESVSRFDMVIKKKNKKRRANDDRHNKPKNPEVKK
jgi:cell fate regulator YaaT (PSP1 superfamily)